MRQDVYAIVRDIVADVFGVRVDLLSPEVRFIEDLAASMDFEETIIACEQAFGIKIPDEEAAALETIGLLASYISARISATEDIWPPPPSAP